MRGLAGRHHIVGRAVEDDHGRVGRVDVRGGIERLEMLLVALEREAHHGLLRAVVPAVLGSTAAHIVQVHGSRPVAGRIHAAAEGKVAAHGALQLRHAAAGRGQRREVAAGRETRRGHERRIQPVLGGVGPHVADHALDVLDLGRKLGVGRRTVVGRHDGIARVEQGVDDGAQVGHPLGIVGEPGAAVNVDHDRIGLLLHPGQVDVHLVVNLSVAGVIDVRELLGAVHLDLRHLEPAETPGGTGSRLLRPGAESRGDADCNRCGGECRQGQKFQCLHNSPNLLFFLSKS